MAAGVERTVRMGSMAYVDPDGATRRADCGAVVLVHPENIDRFDRLNRLQGAPEQEPVAAAVVEHEDHVHAAPTRRRRTRKPAES